VPPVFQLTVDDLIALRGSPTIALVRPPGRILLDHRRREALASLRSETKAPHAVQKAHVTSVPNAAPQAGDNSRAFVPDGSRLLEEQ
jgi:hypothetical protein